MPKEIGVPSIMPIQTQEGVLSRIQEHRRQIRNLGVKRLGLFGSFVRQQQGDDSDIDVLVETGNICEKDLELFRYVETAEQAWQEIPSFYDLGCTPED